MSDKEKILFVQKINEDEFETESLWCLKDGGNFIVDNIPFIAKRVSLGDTIKVEYDADEKAFYFDDFVKVSGNSTVRLYFEDESKIAAVREELNAFGCEGEIFLLRKILAVNVPHNVDYKPVRNFLDEGALKQKWQYEESCLVHEIGG